MKRLSAAYHFLIIALAAAAGALLAGVVIAVALDVFLRTAGFQPFAATSTLIEYTMLWVTMLAGPWLVRSRGHIVVESLVLVFSPRLRFWIERVVLVLCAALAGAITWYAAKLGLHAFERGDIDVRAIDMPRWVLFASLAGGFFLMTIEFLRLVVIGGTVQAPRRGDVKDGL